MSNNPASVTPDSAKDGNKGKDSTNGANNKREGFHYKQANFVVLKQAKFEGKCNNLKGHIYDCSHAKQADQFTKTTKEISEYIGRTYKYGGDIRLAVINLAPPVITMLADPPQGATETQKVVWKTRVQQFIAREDKLDENLRNLYSLIWGQCTDIMRQKVEATVGYNEISEQANSIELLKIIKTIAFNFQSQKHLPHALHEAKRRCYSLIQTRNMTTQAYLELFQNTVDVIEHTGGSIGVKPGIIRAYNRASGYPEDRPLTAAKQVIRQGIYLGTAFILGPDRARYGKLVENLENDFLQGRDGYPITLTGAYNLLTNWKQDPRNNLRAVGSANDGVAFTSIDDHEEGDEGQQPDIMLNTTGKKGRKKREPRDKSTITCRRCGKRGHWPSECDNPRLKPTSETEGVPNDQQAAATLLTSGTITHDSENEEGIDDIIVGFQFLNKGSGSPPKEKKLQGFREHGYCLTANQPSMSSTKRICLETSGMEDVQWTSIVLQE
jgi:hypothetical protein